MADLWVPWNALKEFILQVLFFFHNIFGDYGLAIIALTIAIRIVLIPLTVKQTKSMYEMQRIQPKLKALQEKYKKDKQKLQEETLKFYQENKVNPFGGCLPLLLQMPIFIALFQVLGGPDRKKLPPVSTSFVLFLEGLPAEAAVRAKQFLFILSDLTQTPGDIFSKQGLLAALPYLVLVVLFGLSAWLPQHMMSQDKQQRQIGAYMGVMMLWFGWISPAGVLLYWVTSSAWQIGQQVIIMRVYGSKEGA